MTELLTRPQPASRATVAAGRFVRCTVGGGAFALPLAHVAEVVALGAATTTAPHGWIGTLARDERPVPIGDLAFLLGLPSAGQGRREVRALILRAGADGARYGVTIEAVPQVFNAGETRPERLPRVAASPAGGLVSGTIVQGGELLLVLDAEAIGARLAAGLTRAPDGRITALRALPRRNDDAAGHAITRGTAGQPPRLRGEQTALTLAPLEAADGSGSFLPAVPLEWIQEVCPWQPARPLPHGPAALSGLIVWRGHALPVLDLTRCLTGLPDEAGAALRRRLLIIGPQRATPRGALLIPGVRGLRTLRDEPGAAHATPPTLPDPAVLRAWAYDGAEAVALLDPAILFA